MLLPETGKLYKFDKPSNSGIALYYVNSDSMDNELCYSRGFYTDKLVFLYLSLDTLYSGERFLYTKPPSDISHKCVAVPAAKFLFRNRIVWMLADSLQKLSLIETNHVER